MEKDHHNEQLKRGLRDVHQAKQGGAGGAAGLAGILSSPDLWGKLATNPQTQQLLQDEGFLQMMRHIQQDPSALNLYSNDPRLMQVLQVALSSASASSSQQQQQSQQGQQAAGEGSKEGRPSESGGGKGQAQQKQQEEEREKDEWEKEKEAGNDAYKSKEFDKALEHYSKAMELNPDDIAIRTNRAAVFLEKGEYDKSLQECDDAVEHGRSIRADYKMIAKALTRKGNAYYKQGNLEEAIRWYQSALTEHRNPDTLKRLNEAEKKLKKRKEEEYMDPSLGEEARQRGNDSFKEGDYPSAIKEYEEAVKRNPQDYKAYSNRAACYQKLGSWYEAFKDAEKCIEIEPTFAKGYSRKAHVQYFMKEYHKALDTYRAGLEHDPENQELQQGVRACMEQIQRANRGEISEEEQKERQERALSDPEIQQILQDPMMKQVLQDLQNDPQSAQAHLNNPGIAEKLQKLVNAGVVRMQ